MISTTQLAQEVHAMRQLQKDYFAKRDVIVLSKCKAKEIKVDQLCKLVLGYEPEEKQLNLFK